MKILWILWFLILNTGTSTKGEEDGKNAYIRPATLNIGAILNFDSIVGRVAKLAIETAVEDVNSDSVLLRGTKLVLTMQDNKYNGFLGIVEALKLMVTKTVAIIGPQSSFIAHIISFVADELQVPLLSFAATDPSLSSLQYPFFVRTTHSDLYQMAAVADIVDFYGWKEVTVIFVDDDFGRNGVAALGDQLAERRCKILYKAVMSLDVNRDDITNVLLKVASMESRVLVLHTYTKWGIQIFDVAHHLGMTGNGYVWITTDWLSNVLDSSPQPYSLMNSIQGVITLRMHTPDSERKHIFFSRWGNLTKTRGGSLGLSTYGLYAYDTVWLLAHALDAFLDGETISFSKDAKLQEIKGGNLNFAAMSVFDGGNKLLKNILQSNLSGLTGRIQFTSDGSLFYPAYDVLNVIGSSFKTIGYWSNYSGLSTLRPEKFYEKPPNRSSSNQHLYSVTWPGQTTKKPRGWVFFPDNGKHLRIGVPRRVTYPELLTTGGSGIIEGYCIDVFTAALKLLPYGVPYKLIPYGDGHQNPNYNELVNLITSDVFDAVIGDIAIVTRRTRIVDFTQPYIKSGLVVVVPVNKLSAWAFMQPFTPALWSVLCILFFLVAASVWILEHRINDEFRGPPKQQVSTVLWFSFSTLFFLHRENTLSALGRFVMFIWLFVVLIITSSYTASLTSIITVQQLSSPINGIDSLIASREPIGYPDGSFAGKYLTEELHIPKSRLVPLGSPDAYVKALQDGPRRGGVAAMVDERAYVELFLSNNCNFTIVGTEFARKGWGFAFPRESPLAMDMSTAILTLAENDDLQRIHDKWFKRSTCNYQNIKVDSNQLQLRSFEGLFIICGLASCVAFLIYFILVLYQFRKHCIAPSESSAPQASIFEHLQSFLMFVDQKEQVKSPSRIRRFKSSSKGNAISVTKSRICHMEPLS